MPEHIHRLISAPRRGTQSTVMQVIKQRFARAVLGKKKKKAKQLELSEEPAEHVWQRRFHDHHVWSERKRVEKLRYMHRNPVRAELVEEPEQWAWSSYRSYAYGQTGKVRINEWPEAVMKIHPAA